MKKLFLTIPICILSLNFIYGQFIVNNNLFQPTGLSNQGDVVGYVNQAGPYSIWKPDSSLTVDINGLAPGQGIGGQARFSDDSNFLCGTSSGPLGAELSRYNQTTHQWSVLGNLGFAIDNTTGGGFGISGDGNTIVGLSWADTTGSFGSAHAVAWNQSEGIMDLGSLHDSIGASTRANAVSHDGKIVVGWQDFNGPWKSAVWRKNPAGGYFPNEYLLIDTLGNPNDEFNQLGECSAISSDGVWIGGYGDYANNNQPWIWSRQTGVINLGSLPNTGQGFVSGINADGTVVVGWFDGVLWGDSQTPFIWTPSGGLKNLNNYIHNDLGLSTGAIKVSTASCMSSNGTYIAGYGVDTITYNFITYRVSPTANNSVSHLDSNTDVSIFPNPFALQTNIVFGTEQENIHLKIVDLVGQEIKTINFTGKQLVLNKDNLAPGIYFVQIINDNKNIVTKKIVVQ